MGPLSHWTRSLCWNYGTDGGSELKGVARGHAAPGAKPKGALDPAALGSSCSAPHRPVTRQRGSCPRGDLFSGTSGNISPSLEPQKELGVEWPV